MTKPLEEEEILYLRMMIAEHKKSNDSQNAQFNLSPLELRFINTCVGSGYEQEWIDLFRESRRRGGRER